MESTVISLCLIVARSRNKVIGRDGDLPWRLKDDFAHFKRMTLGHPVIMGRKTWESLPKRPLPGRMNIVVSRDWTYDAPGARVFSSLGPAVAVARANALREGVSRVFIIGGAMLYQATLALADEIMVTEVDAEVDGDALFDFDEACWREVQREAVAAGEGNDHSFEIRMLERVE